MKSAWVVMKRELASFFVSPLAYVVLTSWLVWNGVVFWVLTEFYARNAVSSGAASPLSAFFRRKRPFLHPPSSFRSHPRDAARRRREAVGDNRDVDDGARLGDVRHPRQVRRVAGHVVRVVVADGRVRVDHEPARKR